MLHSRTRRLTEVRMWLRGGDEGYCPTWADLAIAAAQMPLGRSDSDVEN